MNEETLVREDTELLELVGFKLGEEEFEKIRQYIYDTGAYQITYRPEPTESDFAEYLHTQSTDVDSWEP